MNCLQDSVCWTFAPELPPPPPPIPSFLSDDVNLFLNQTQEGQLRLGLSSCDLCGWAGATVGYEEVADNDSLPLSSLLVIVALVSALTGAGLTAAVLSFRKLRRRKFDSGSESVRHLARKMNDPSRPAASASSFSSGTLTENTYCEGPYNNENNAKENCSSNIYAELHTGINIHPGIWNRPPVAPPIQNCYLELKDLPNRCRRCLPPVPPHWQATEVTEATASPNSSTYYSDLDRNSAQPV